MALVWVDENTAEKVPGVILVDPSSMTLTAEGDGVYRLSCTGQATTTSGPTTTTAGPTTTTAPATTTTAGPTTTRPCILCDEGPCILCDQGDCTNCDEGSCSNCDEGVCSLCDEGTCMLCDETGCTVLDDYTTTTGTTTGTTTTGTTTTGATTTTAGGTTTAGATTTVWSAAACCVDACSGAFPIPVWCDAQDEASLAFPCDTWYPATCETTGYCIYYRLYDGMPSPPYPPSSGSCSVLYGCPNNDYAYELRNASCTLK